MIWLYEICKHSTLPHEPECWLSRNAPQQPAQLSKHQITGYGNPVSTYARGAWKWKTIELDMCNTNIKEYRWLWFSWGTGTPVHAGYWEPCFILGRGAWYWNSLLIFRLFYWRQNESTVNDLVTWYCLTNWHIYSLTTTTLKSCYKPCSTPLPKRPMKWDKIKWLSAKTTMIPSRVDFHTFFSWQKICCPKF